VRRVAVQVTKAVLDSLVHLVGDWRRAGWCHDRRLAAASEGAERVGVSARWCCHPRGCTDHDRGAKQNFPDQQCISVRVVTRVYKHGQDPACRGQNAAMLTPTKNPAW
jgi:hypothetical protein